MTAAVNPQPVPPPLGDLLALAVRRGASDLHLSAGAPPMLRVDGAVEPLPEPALQSAQLEAWLAPLLAADDLSVQEAQDADFAIELPEVGRFRANVFRHQRGLGAVLRTVPAHVPSLAELGMGPVFEQMAAAPHGLVVVAGPTGSGKSTTLAALVDHVNRHRPAHILTIEDPIEFIHRPRRSLVHQRQLGRDTGSFADALRAALREDPDVILVGEMRDLATMRMALAAAETGHLVFATLHTGTAPQTIDRIVNAFPAAEQAATRAALAESLTAVVAQALLPKAGGGRVAAHEIMLATAAVRNLIREHKLAQLRSVIQTGAAQGMQTLEQAKARLNASGVLAAKQLERLTRPAGGLDSAEPPA